MQPIIAVGLLCEPSISFSFTGIYSAPDNPIVTGAQKVEISQSGLALVWNGKTLPSIEFSPSSPEGNYFEIDGVTIGVKFHWERKESQRFRGRLRLVPECGKVRAINDVEVEEYLKSVISSEMSATASLNLLRAHAVISRSWLLAQIEGKRYDNPEVIIRDKDNERIRWWDRSNHSNFDVCADDHCQRYQGITRVSSPNAIGAVDDTRGQVLMYDNTICDARFSKCCGGILETFETCWEDLPHPYLAAVRDLPAETPVPDVTTAKGAKKWIEDSPDAFCNIADARILSQVLNNYDRETADFYRWKVEYTAEELSAIINQNLNDDLGEITALTPLSRGASGRIFRLEITGTEKSIVIGKELEIRRVLSRSHLYSSAFYVTHSGNRFTLNGAGWGHGVGLCQIGAAVMGDMGYTYGEILSHYYKGAEIKTLY
ncbi:MAG: SpoIID/LytB domain-containing protein [Duncaniella sp.]|nr:SpoIID/LytB domain-containing protein [Duncaniella sp.]